MPSLGDSAFIFILALLLFGPKKLPELARQLGKLMAEFRRASNEFRMQMEDELRVSEQADRQKEIAAIQAAAPVTPALESGASNSIASAESTPAGAADEIEDPLASHPHMAAHYEAEPVIAPAAEAVVGTASDAATPAAEPFAAEPVPIATSGSLTMRPPKTGMPFAQTMGTAPSRAASPLLGGGNTPLSPLFDSIPQAPPPDLSAAASDPLDAEGRGTLASTEVTHHG